MVSRMANRIMTKNVPTERKVLVLIKGRLSFTSKIFNGQGLGKGFFFKIMSRSMGVIYFNLPTP